jgi:hypothetical protein
MIKPSEHFIRLFKKTNGALSVCEAIAIINITSNAPQGEYIELGSFHGKSAMSAAYSLKPGMFWLVDPIFDDTELSLDVMQRVVMFAETTLHIRTVPDYSTNVIEKHDKYAYVMVDSGSHGDGLPMQEVKMLEDRVVSGGIIAFHDYNSQFVEVKEASDYLINTGKYETIQIDWEKIKDYVRENDLENGNTSWHHNELDFPCFLGALKRK